MVCSGPGQLASDARGVQPVGAKAAVVQVSQTVGVKGEVGCASGWWGRW